MKVGGEGLNPKWTQEKKLKSTWGLGERDVKSGGIEGGRTNKDPKGQTSLGREKKSQIPGSSKKKGRYINHMHQRENSIAVWRKSSFCKPCRADPTNENQYSCNIQIKKKGKKLETVLRS